MDDRYLVSNGSNMPPWKMAGYGQGLEANAYNAPPKPGAKGGGKPRAGMGARRMPLAQTMAAANQAAAPQQQVTTTAAG